MEKKFQNDVEEFNPNLQFDALTAGIEDGGLRSKNAIATITCYILANTNDKITSKHIVDTLVEGKIANYFEACDAISKMIKKGNFTEDKDGTLHITSDCRRFVDLVEKDLPISIREKSIEMCRKIVIKDIYKKENKVEIEEKNNRYIITMHVSDKNADFMTLSLTVPTKTQAIIIKEKFQNNPGFVYESLIGAIFSDEQDK